MTISIRLTTISFSGIAKNYNFVVVVVLKKSEERLFLKNNYACPRVVEV